MWSRIIRSLVPTLLTAVTLAATSFEAAAQQAQPIPEPDVILGTWYLDVAKSTFNPGPAPKSQTRTYALDKNGIKTTIDTVHADGHTAFVQLISDYSGDQVPISG